MVRRLLLYQDESRLPIAFLRARAVGHFFIDSEQGHRIWCHVISNFAPIQSPEIEQALEW
jgi:hypothetical protein